MGDGSIGKRLRQSAEGGNAIEQWPLIKSPDLFVYWSFLAFSVSKWSTAIFRRRQRKKETSRYEVNEKRFFGNKIRKGLRIKSDFGEKLMKSSLTDWHSKTCQKLQKYQGDLGKIFGLVRNILNTSL